MSLHQSVHNTPLSFTMRTAIFRNGIVSGINSFLTLAILLIAPLGLAAVVVTTLLVMLASFLVGIVVDVAVAWLLPSSTATLLSRSQAIKKSPKAELQNEFEEP